MVGGGLHFAILDGVVSERGVPAIVYVSCSVVIAHEAYNCAVNPKSLGQVLLHPESYHAVWETQKACKAEDKEFCVAELQSFSNSAQAPWTLIANRRGKREFRTEDSAYSHRDTAEGWPRRSQGSALEFPRGKMKHQMAPVKLKMSHAEGHDLSCCQSLKPLLKSVYALKCPQKRGCGVDSGQRPFAT